MLPRMEESIRSNLFLFLFVIRRCSQVKVAIDGQGSYEICLGEHFFLSVGDRQLAESSSESGRQ